jgi:hypothetical protein
MKSNERAIAAAVLVLLGGCRAGGMSGALPASSLGSASFSIVVPKPDGGPRFSMQSLTVRILDIDGKAAPASASTAAMNLSKQTRGCTILADGALSCVATIAAPSGRDTFVVTTYAQPNARGAVVSTSSVTTAISSGRQTNCVKRASPGV